MGNFNRSIMVAAQGPNSSHLIGSHSPAQLIDVFLDAGCFAGVSPNHLFFPVFKMRRHEQPSNPSC
jgi:hypothetical protein